MCFEEPICDDSDDDYEGTPGSEEHEWNKFWGNKKDGVDEWSRQG